MVRDVFADIRATLGDTRGAQIGGRGGLAGPARITGTGPSYTPTSVGGINFGTGAAPYSGNITSTDDLIARMSPQAEAILRQGTADAVDLTGQGLSAQIAQLSGYQNRAALDEQSAILGLSGADAQRQAISNIPVSAAERELQEMEAERLRRQGAATGNLTSGAGLLSQQQLGAQQSASRISNRLNELESLAGIDRQVASDISRLTEAAGARTAGLQSGLGNQLSSVYLGTAPAAVQSMQARAELDGLRRIGAANNQANTYSQLANLAGQGYQAYQAYQAAQADPYGFGGADPFSTSSYAGG